MMKTKISYLAIFIFTLLLSCQKDIQIKMLPYSNQLSIECILTPGQKPQCFVSFSEAFFSDNSTPSDLFVHGAVVTINGVTNDALVEDSTDNSHLRLHNYNIKKDPMRYFIASVMMGSYIEDFN